MSMLKHKLVILVLGSGLGLMSNQSQVLAQSDIARGVRSPAELAALNQVDQIIDQLHSPSNEQPPAVTLRPAEDVIDSCEVDVLESTSGQGYQLRVAVPDSVSSIEVVPASTSNRQFRIRLEENNSGEQSITRLDSQNSNLLSPLRSPRELHQMMNAGQNEQGSISKHQNASRSGFTDNPFFATSAIGTSRATNRRVKAEQPPADDQVESVSLLLSENEKQYATRILTSAPQAADQPIKTDQNTIESFVIEGVISVPRKTIGQPIRQVRVAANSPIAVSGAKASTPKAKVAVTSIKATAAPVKATRTPTKAAPAPNAGIGQAVSVSLDGPAELKVGAAGDYTVTVRNNSMFDINNVNVRLATSQGLDVLVIERAADFDKQNRTLVWNIHTLKAGQQFQTRYRAASSSAGKLLHAIDMGQGTTYSAKAAELSTVGVDSEAKK